MNIDQIQANKPEGATHYRGYTGQYFKFDGFDWFVLIGNQWKYIRNVCLFELKPL